MSSREIAELTGKQHKHILRDCEVLNQNYEKMGMPKIGLTPYVHPQNGQTYNEMSLTKIQTMDLMTGYKIDLRIKVNRRWEELETNSLNSAERIELENYRSSAKQRLIKSSRIKELDFLIKEQMKERDLLRRELNIIDRNDYQQLTLLGFDLNSIETERKFLEKIN